MARPRPVGRDVIERYDGTRLIKARLDTAHDGEPVVGGRAVAHRSPAASSHCRFPGHCQPCVDDPFQLGEVLRRRIHQRWPHPADV